ncbi:hypothetical protein ACW14X_27995 [Nocardioides sp. YJ-D4]
MNLYDLFAPTRSDEWFNDVDQLRTDVIERLRAQPLAGDDDLETALTLTQLVHGELMEYGTKAEIQRLDNEELAATLRTLRAVLARHGITLDLPWRNYDGFRTYWIKQNASGPGGWQARREILERFFEPVFAELHRIEDMRFAAAAAEPVSPAGKTGWSAVDHAVEDIRVRFRSASNAADYSDVGRRCIALMEVLSATVYDPARHLRPGEEVPPVPRTHMRIGRYVEVEFEGAENEKLRGLVRKTAEFAEAVKHRHTSTRRDAGIAADTVILLANILRRLDVADT